MSGECEENMRNLRIELEERYEAEIRKLRAQLKQRRARMKTETARAAAERAKTREEAAHLAEAVGLLHVLVTCPVNDSSTWTANNRAVRFLATLHLPVHP